jgi:uncharacterized membrane protein YvbJ
MKIQCTDFDNLLMEDDAFSMETAERHARECAQCAAKLASWNEISTTARDLHTTWPSDTLWPRIARSLKNEQRTARSWMWQVAAAILILVSLALVVYKANQLNKSERILITEDAVQDADKTQHEFEKSIKQLEKLSGDKLDDPATPIMVSYKEKLMLLDDAIAECQTAIDQNRANAQVRKQLLAMYTEKQRTLRDVLREDTSVSHQ